MRKGSVLLAVVLASFVFTGPGFAQVEGGKVFARCAACHKDNGQGVAGVFPPLVGHAPEIAKAPGGRDYLIKQLLYGLQGEIKIAGKTYNGTMPANGDLKDEEVAAVLNHVLKSWGNDKLLPPGFKEIGAAEVKKARAKKLSSKEVLQARGKLGLK